MVGEIDEFKKKYSVNRTDIIVEAIKSYLSSQIEKELYDNFDASCKELKSALDNPGEISNLGTLNEFIDENSSS